MFIGLGTSIDNIFNIYLLFNFLVHKHYFWAILTFLFCIIHRIVVIFIIYYTDYNWKDTNLSEIGKKFWGEVILKGIYKFEITLSSKKVFSELN